MLCMKCQEHFQAVFAFAVELGDESLQSLERCVFRYADDENKIVKLYQDRAPYSFVFDVYRIEHNVVTFWYCGGIIYHESDGKWESHT
jgi:hypothetical protein